MFWGLQAPQVKFSFWQLLESIWGNYVVHEVRMFSKHITKNISIAFHLIKCILSLKVRHKYCLS